MEDIKFEACSKFEAKPASKYTKMLEALMENDGSECWKAVCPDHKIATQYAAGLRSAAKKLPVTVRQDGCVIYVISD